MIEDRDDQLPEGDPNSWLDAPVEVVQVALRDQPTQHRLDRTAKTRPVAVQVAVVAGWFSIPVAIIGAVGVISAAALGLLVSDGSPAAAPPPPVINCIEYQREALELQAQFPDREYWQTGIVQDQCRINQLLNDGEATPP